MKKIILGIVLLFSLAANSQSWTPIAGKQRFTTGFGLPVKDSSFYTNGADTALLYVNPNDSSLYWRFKGYHKKVNYIAIDSVTRFGGLQTIYQSYLDSLVLAAAIQKNTDSLAQHNLRIGANTVNIAANTTNIAANASTIATNTTAIAGKVSKQGDTISGNIVFNGNRIVSINRAGVGSANLFSSGLNFIDSASAGVYRGYTSYNYGLIARDSLGWANVATILLPSKSGKLSLLSDIDDNKLTIRNSTSSTVHTPKRLVFNNSTGISYTGSDTALVALGSSFKTWKIAGQPSLVAVGDDSLSIIKRWGLSLVTDTTTGNKKLTISIDSTQVPFIDSSTYNLFNYSASTFGAFMDNAGNITYNSGFAISDFIPVTVGTTYRIGNYVSLASTSAQGRFTTYYNSSKQVVAGGSNSAVSSITIPSGVAFVRFTFTRAMGENTIFFNSFSDGVNYVNYKGDALRSYAKVTAANAKFVSKSINLFNKATSVDGYFLSNTNTSSANSAFGYSDYIPVTVGLTYYGYDGYLSQPIRFTTYYDANYTYVAGGSSTSISSFTVPSGVSFVRVTYNINNTTASTTGKNTFMLVMGNSYQNYQQFKYGFETDATTYQDSVNQVTWGLHRLSRLQAWKTYKTANYNLITLGDSWTDGNYWGKKLQDNFINAGYNYGGAGYCNFFGGDGALNSASLDSTKLKSNWATAQWTTNFSTSWGIAASDITSVNSSSTITITAGEAYDSIRLIYKRQSGGAGFQWKINSGGFTTQATTAVSDSIGTLSIYTGGSGNSFTITIQANGSGVSFSGCFPVINSGTNYQLRLHKAGLTGSQASNFASTALWQSAVSTLSPNGVVFMWGTNEQNGNIAPSVMKAYIQRQVNYIRGIDSTIDLLFMCPASTKFDGTKSYYTREYAKVYFQLAQENNGAFIDLNKAFRPFTRASITSGLMAADSIHPGTFGGYIIANSMGDALIGSAIQPTKNIDRQGTATLSAGSVVVPSRAVTANSVIQLTLQNCSTCGTPYISAKTAGQSFTISSTNMLDGSTVGWQIIKD